jgi:hypothetical protein
MSDAPDYVIATYREIADRFELADTRTARNKAKRAGWVHEPVNHPADPRRCRVPRARWDKALNPRSRRSDPEGPDVQTVNEHGGSGVQTVDSHPGSLVQTGDEHPGSGLAGHGGSNLQTEDEPGGVKSDLGGSKRRTTRDQEQRIRDLEAMVGVLHEQLTRERQRADASDARVVELTVKLVELAERRTTLAAQLAKAARAGRSFLLELLPRRS